MQKTIFLLRIGKTNPSHIIQLRKDLKWIFGKYRLDVKILPESLTLKNWYYNEGKKQYCAKDILDDIIKLIQKKHYFRTLGIVDVDIYDPLRDYAFGAARVPKKLFLPFSGVCLISVTRLKEDFYKRKQNKALEELRILKEAVHELGHTLGLNHCKNKGCVMQFSKKISDADEKKPLFCEDCKESLNYFFTDICHFY